MHTIIAVSLALILHQASSADVALPALANTTRAVFGVGALCQPDGPIGCTEDCKGQRYCLFGREVIVNCYTQTDQLYCNPNTVQCTSSTNILCPKEIPPFDCPRVGYFPYALDCRRIYVCSQQPPPQVLSCTNNMIFDVLTKSCSLNAVCYTFSPINGLCKDKENSMVVHPRNKAIFAFCSGNFPTINECPTNHVFNVAKLVCDFECPSRGNFPDPTNRQCYFSCSSLSTGYRINRLCCPSGQIFVENIGTCGPPM